MAYFAVNYQLNANKDYPKLWAEMDRLDGHKVLRSFYFLDLDISAADLRNHLKGYIDDDDAVVVVPFDLRPHHHMAYAGTNDWINARFG
ncbi:hypothetical protein [Allomesorhizobium alhagi]|uniref:Uncharacterized protein n=1 Tax=Mesorhizobium alhagi CCNWXJ12-2 TaxID=1107882 RepID=H0HR54_9HYPH|nr:hypothetical protein [Mesorhizobium alhagi]EHK56788.1 hypothetical protein MAXJ12_13186 [Mesorhizobium alhagi CCNWXJ12-2]